MVGNGKVAVITGAKSGIAFEAKKSLLARGYRVAALDVSTDALEAVRGTTGNLLVDRCRSR